jgi:hypothetical protein
MTYTHGIRELKGEPAVSAAEQIERARRVREEGSETLLGRRGTPGHVLLSISRQETAPSRRSASSAVDAWWTSRARRTTLPGSPNPLAA